MPSLRPRFWGELNAIIEKNNLYKVDGSIASYETKAKRQEVIHGGFRYLASVGCRLISPTQFKERHMFKLVAYWEENNVADIQTKISFFRTFGNHWIRKPGMIKESVKYATNPQSVARRYVSNVDKTWSGKGIDVLDMVQKVTVLDARVGLLMELGVAFGARLKEALCLHPHTDLRTAENEDGEKREYIHVRNGKGGRQRDIEIEQSGPLRDYQLDLLERAKAIAARPGASLIQDGKSAAYQRNRVYYILRKAGVARNLNGVTFHGLRHEYAVSYYERRTGVAAPLKGNPEQPDPALDQKTREDLSENLGHSRTSILGCYIGSRHRPVPQTGCPEAAKTEEAEAGKDVSNATGAKTNTEKPDPKKSRSAEANAATSK